MPLIHLSVQHGHTFDEAKKRLETAVHEIQSRFSALVPQVEWSTDRSQVRLEGIGFWIEMQVDAQLVHVSADIPVLGRLLGGSVTTRLKEIVQRTFQLKLPEGNGTSEMVRRCAPSNAASHRASANCETWSVWISSPLPTCPALSGML
jgi:hypothetical protein